MPGSPPLVVSSLAPALATGGAGDVLTGVCAALACHLPLREAALTAAFLHGRSAGRWMSETGADRGLLARQVADGIPAEIASLLAR
jgi:NAD(P)H-hydrate repair Nnr-like enzyme with NAD(P)H-hydrate dehydratase domain